MDLPSQLKINLKYTASIEVYAINSFPFYVNFMEISVIDEKPWKFLTLYFT